MARKKRRKTSQRSSDLEKPKAPQLPEDLADQQRGHEWFDGQRFVDPGPGGVKTTVLIQMQRGLVPLLDLRPHEVRRLRDSGQISQKDLDAWRAQQIRRAPHP